MSKTVEVITTRGDVVTLYNVVTIDVVDKELYLYAKYGREAGIFARGEWSYLTTIEPEVGKSDDYVSRSRIVDMISTRLINNPMGEEEKRYNEIVSGIRQLIHSHN